MRVGAGPRVLEVGGGPRRGGERRPGAGLITGAAEHFPRRCELERLVPRLGHRCERDERLPRERGRLGVTALALLEPRGVQRRLGGEQSVVRRSRALRGFAVGRKRRVRLALGSEDEAEVVLHRRLDPRRVRTAGRDRARARASVARGRDCRRESRPARVRPSPRRRARAARRGVRAAPPPLRDRPGLASGGRAPGRPRRAARALQPDASAPRASAPSRPLQLPGGLPLPKDRR